MLANDRIARGLRQQAAKIRPSIPSAAAKHVERVEHAIDIERGGFDRDDDEIARSDAGKRGVRAEPRGVDNDQPEFCEEPMGRAADVGGRVLNDGYAAEGPLARRKPRNRTLWIGTRRPCRCQCTARQLASVLLPLPPFIVAMVMIEVVTFSIPGPDWSWERDESIHRHISH